MIPYGNFSIRDLESLCPNDATIAKSMFSTSKSKLSFPFQSIVGRFNSFASLRNLFATFLLCTRCPDDGQTTLMLGKIFRRCTLRRTFDENSSLPRKSADCGDVDKAFHSREDAKEKRNLDCMTTSQRALPFPATTMAKFVIAGKADCPRYARAEQLADDLATNLPSFQVHKIIKSASEWPEWLKTQCDDKNWQHADSPLIWRELVNRGGKGKVDITVYLAHMR